MKQSSKDDINTVLKLCPPYCFVKSLPHLSPLLLLTHFSSFSLTFDRHRHTTTPLPLTLYFSLLLCLLSSANSPPLISHARSLPFSISYHSFCTSPLLWHLLSLSLSPAGFIASLPDNSPVLTGWSYYPLYEMSMLRALYEILVPVDKMMELVSAVIPQPYNGDSWEIHNAMDYW